MEYRVIARQAQTLPELLVLLREAGATEVEKRSAVEEYLRIRAWQAAIPRYGKFELTPLCNLDCKMCYIHLQKEQLQGKTLLPADTWKRLMTQAVQAGMRVASLTGGECLTYPGFEELYLHLQEQGVEVTVLTNGVLLDEARIRFFREHPPRRVQISLYGSSEDAYEKVTGHRLYARVMKHLQLAREAELPVSVAVTPSAFMEDAEDIIRMLSDMGQHYQINSGLFEPYEETGRKGQSIDCSVERYMQLYQLQARLKGKQPDEAAEDEDCLPVPEREPDGGIGLLCGAGNNSFSVDAQGRMYACGMLRECSVDLLHRVPSATTHKNHAPTNPTI
ncbi:MAG: radical SAM/SPASM domain-containing protein, partial [Aristaeellaceae bacterium]